MKCEINLEELKTLLTGKYKAKEIGWDEILLFGRYFGFKKYDIFSLTEAEMTNTNNRFYLIDNREVLEKYSTLDLGEYLTEYILVNVVTFASLKLGCHYLNHIRRKQNDNE